MKIVERIKQKCEEKGTKMGTLEKELGFANGSIRRWDERTPGADKVLILANRLSVSVDWLLTGKESGELTAEEQRLIDNWRRTADPGRKTVQDVSNAMASTYPRQETSSSSKIG